MSPSAIGGLQAKQSCCRKVRTGIDASSALVLPDVQYVGSRKMTVRIALALLAIAFAWPTAAASIGDGMDPQLLDQIAARRKAAGAEDGRIRVTDKGTCNDGMPTCYDGPSNTIIIAGDPTKYLYRTVPEPGQPSLYPYSWARAVYRETQKAFLWWVEEKRVGVDTAEYDRANILPAENEYLKRRYNEPYRLCGHSVKECMELKGQ